MKLLLSFLGFRMSVIAFRCASGLVDLESANPGYRGLHS